MEEANRHKKHNAKRTMIQISLYSKDRSLMRNKYSKILNATEAKEILLTGELKVITQNIDPLLPEVRTELRRIGNNINQLANLANAKKEIPAVSMLKLQLMEIHELIDHLYRIKP